MPSVRTIQNKKTCSVMHFNTSATSNYNSSLTASALKMSCPSCVQISSCSTSDSPTSTASPSTKYCVGTTILGILPSSSLPAATAGNSIAWDSSQASSCANHSKCKNSSLSSTPC